MRTCAHEFRRGRPSAHYKAARNGPAPEKERHFGAFSLPRFRPFPSPVLLSVRPRSDRCFDLASDSCPFPACIPPDPGLRRAGDRSRFPAVRLPRRRSRDARSDRILDSTALTNRRSWDARSAVARPRVRRRRPIGSDSPLDRRGSIRSSRSVRPVRSANIFMRF